MPILPSSAISVPSNYDAMTLLSTRLNPGTKSTTTTLATAQRHSYQHTSTHTKSTTKPTTTQRHLDQHASPHKKWTTNSTTFVKEPTCSRLRWLDSAVCSVLICVEMTDSTDTSIRLNSSKQPHAPHWARPEKILPMDCGQTTTLWVINVKLPLQP